jgi:IS5 family transposase
LTTKIHAAVSENGKLQKVQLTPFQQNDVTQAQSLLENEQAEKVVADKAYDSDEVCKTIRRLGARPAIPSRREMRQRR